MWNQHYMNPNRWDPGRYNPEFRDPARIDDRGHNPWGISEDLPYNPIYSKEELCTIMVNLSGKKMIHINEFEAALKDGLDNKRFVQIGPDQYQVIDKEEIDHAMSSYILAKDQNRLDGWAAGQHGSQKQLPPIARDDDGDEEKGWKRKKPKQIGSGDTY